MFKSNVSPLAVLYIAETNNEVQMRTSLFHALPDLLLSHLVVVEVYVESGKGSARRGTNKPCWFLFQDGVASKSSVMSKCKVPWSAVLPVYRQI